MYINRNPSIFIRYEPLLPNPFPNSLLGKRSYSTSLISLIPVINPISIKPSNEKFELKKSLKDFKTKNLQSNRKLCSIKKNELHDLQFIATIWNKIIICYEKKSFTLFAIDQHAIHERISYEIYCEIFKRDINDIKEIKGFDYDVLRLKNKNICYNFYKIIQNKNEFQNFIINENNINKFEKYYNEFKKYGFQIIIDKINNLIKIISFPIFFDEKINLEKNYNEFFDFFEKKMSNEIGKNYQFPKPIDIILMSKACKNAIKFNDKIHKDDIEKLKRNLKKCDFPFVCVHGRSSFFPMMNLR